MQNARHIAGAQPTPLTTTSGVTLMWLASRCLLPAPWNIDCRQCRDACPEQALSVVNSDEGPWLTVSDACTDCQQCLAACDTEALLIPPVALSRRALFRRAANPVPPALSPADAAPAPRKRWRKEAQAIETPVQHPVVSVDISRCDVSGLCSQLCPSGALQTDAAGALKFDSSNCLGCGNCVELCPNQAITLKTNGTSFSGILRQVERCECSECGHEYEHINAGPMINDDWSQLPLCSACQRNQTLMKQDVMSLLR